MARHRRWRATAAAQARARELRKRQTPAERALWSRLRKKQLLGYKFRRQHPIGCFIVDFCCARVKLVVEIDGESHASQVEYDDSRTAHLEEQGYIVIRFTNDQVLRHSSAVLGEITRVLGELTL
jgi:very-short-patch-repair endonuclease